MGCPRAAHLSKLGFTFWNRISYPFRSYKHRSMIYSNLTAHISFWASRIVPNVQRIFHNSVPCFGTDQQPIPGIFSYQACILMQNFHTNSPLIFWTGMATQKSQKNSNNSVPSFGTDQTVPHGLKPTETLKNT